MTRDVNTEDVFHAPAWMWRRVYGSTKHGSSPISDPNILCLTPEKV